MTTRRSVLRGAIGASALSLPLIRSVSGSLAQEGTPEAMGPPPLPEGCELLAGGLLSPRFVEVGEDGSVYVTEAGAGGDEELFGPPPEGTPDATPEPEAPFATRGFSGQVTKVAPDGTVSVAASGLASYLIGGFEATGPAGIALADGTIYVAVGGPGPETPNLEPIEGQNSVVAIDEATGEATIVADLQASEVANNPDGFAIDSNVYGMDIGDDGLLHVADAGANTVYHVDPATGEATVLAVIPGIEVSEEMQDEMPPGGNPGRGGAFELDPVPTGVAINPDGGTYVSLLSGGPFPPGAAKIVTIGEDGTVTDSVLGLTMATDVKVGPDGNLYAVQISLNFLAEIPDPGNVVRILEDGSFEVVVDGIFLPNGINFDADGNLYIAAGTVTPPGADPAGVLLMCAGVAPPA